MSKIGQRWVNALLGLKPIKTDKGNFLVEHCPECKQPVGTINNKCKYSNTRLHVQI